MISLHLALRTLKKVSRTLGDLDIIYGIVIIYGIIMNNVSVL